MSAAQKQGRLAAAAVGRLHAKIIPFREPTTESLAAWSIFYARLGWRVLPVHVVKAGRCSCGKPADHEGAGKHPRVKDWTNTATTDPEQVAEWWRRWPESSIGVLCASGLVGFDVDHRNGGAETWDRVIAEHNPPACPTYVTGNGLRFLMRDPANRVRHKTTLNDGVDVLAAGGAQTLMPPSWHPNGKRYTWLKGYGPVETRGLPEIPASLLDVIAPPKDSPVKASTVGPPSSRNETGFNSGCRSAPRPASGLLPTPYGRTALARLLQDIASASEGQRHNAIYRAAARAGDLMRQGHVHNTTTYDLLMDAALAAAGDKYSENDLARVIGDAILKPSRGPGA